MNKILRDRETSSSSIKASDQELGGQVALFGSVVA